MPSRAGPSAGSAVCVHLAGWAVFPFRSSQCSAREETCASSSLGKWGVPGKGVARSVSPLVAQGDGLPRLFSLCPVHGQSLAS